MECLAGVGLVAGASVGRNSFEYNRENFQEDRNQRRRAAVKTMSWRIDQAKLWREDVRDLISLTEYKMKMYLIVNVLLCGMDIFLWTEGSLPRGTPHWLMVGSSVSIGSSFNFLILSIWLAMYAAISAQSYEVRLMTQMVRLPIPTWEELEASRTYGSEFEKLEARQMFRVPYVMGWQENLSRPGSQPVASSPAADTGSGAVDPWGLEQSAEYPELGCGFGADVARLRHVKLARQAAIQWQTYDGFARICMSIGVQQLMLALIYYLLGYLFVEVHSTGAAVSGVIGFTVIAETILVKDTSLAPAPRRLAQILLGIGPLAATVAAAHWEIYDDAGRYRYWVVIAFLAHGAYFGLIAFYCRVRELNNGAWLPIAFRSVLYLDAFCWNRINLNAEEPSANGGGPLESIEEDAATSGRAGVQSVRYDATGRPIPVQINDWAPPITQDMRTVQGAPNASRHGGTGDQRSEGFYGSASFLPPLVEQDEPSGDAPEELWSDRLGPGDLPWRVFMVAMSVLVAVWLFAALYALHGVVTGFSLDLENENFWVVQNGHQRHVVPDSYQPWEDNSYTSYTKTGQQQQDAWKYKFKPQWVRNKASTSLLSSSVRDSPRQIMMKWPHLKARPTRVSCDSTGNTLVLSDRIALFSATVLSRTNDHTHEEQTTGDLHVIPQKFSCPSLFGEGLDDVMLSCNSTQKSESTNCDLLALHGQGRHITACALKESAGFISAGVEGVTASISPSWFENFHPSVETVDGQSRSRVEKPLSVSVNPMCRDKAGSGKLSCSVVSTSQGRVVQLGQRSSGKSLVPAEILHEEPSPAAKPVSASSVRGVNARYLGVLHAAGHSIRILDMSKGGLVAGAIDLALKNPATSFCAGGGSFFILTEGKVPELWKMPIPREFADASE